MALSLPKYTWEQLSDQIHKERADVPYDILGLSELIKPAEEFWCQLRTIVCDEEQEANITKALKESRSILDGLQGATRKYEAATAEWQASSKLRQSHSNSARVALEEQQARVEQLRKANHDVVEDTGRKVKENEALTAHITSLKSKLDEYTHEFTKLEGPYKQRKQKVEEQIEEDARLTNWDSRLRNREDELERLQNSYRRDAETLTRDQQLVKDGNAALERSKSSLSDEALSLKDQRRSLSACYGVLTSLLQDDDAVIAMVATERLPSSTQWKEAATWVSGHFMDMRGRLAGREQDLGTTRTQLRTCEIEIQELRERNNALSTAITTEREQWQQEKQNLQLGKGNLENLVHSLQRQLTTKEQVSAQLDAEKETLEDNGASVKITALEDQVKATFEEMNAKLRAAEAANEILREELESLDTFLRSMGLLD